MRRVAIMGARLLAAVALFAAALAPSAQPITAEQKADVLKGIEEMVMKRAFVPGVDFSRWPAFLEKQREAIDKAEDIPTFTQAVNRALREFGFSHISLRTPSAAAARTRTSAVGVGLTVRKEEDGLRVRSVAEQGPAKAVGIKPGDLIIAVNGNRPDSPTVLDGDEGTTVELKIKTSDGEIRDVTIERKRYSTIRPETLTWIDAETALLRVFTFSVGYSRENVEKLMAEASKAKSLILDLRSNGGGASSNLNHLLSLLLPDRTVIGTFVSRNLANRYAESTGGDSKDVVAIAQWAESKVRTTKRSVEPFGGSIVVLVNRGSASASEIVAAALREQAGAKLVGTNTAGAVLASTFGQLPHGFQLQYPVSDFVTAKGVRLERNPLVPDAPVTGPATDGKDPAVEKALELLREKRAEPPPGLEASRPVLSRLSGFPAPVPA